MLITNPTLLIYISLDDSVIESKPKGSTSTFDYFNSIVLLHYLHSLLTDAEHLTEDRQKLIIQTEESLKECAQVARVTIGFRVTMFKINAAINDKLPKCMK